MDFMKQYKTKLKRIKEHKPLPFAIDKYLTNNLKGRQLFERITTLPSADDIITNESTRFNHKRLEYLGDTVLDLAVTTIIFERAPISWDNQLIAKAVSLLVQNANLEGTAKKLLLDDYIRPEIEDDQLFIKAIANTFESLIGAIYLQSEKKLDFCIDFLLEPSVLKDEIEMVIKNTAKIIEAELDMIKANKEKIGEEQIHLKPYTLVQAFCKVNDREFIGEGLTNARARKDLFSRIYSEKYMLNNYNIKQEDFEIMQNPESGNYEILINQKSIQSFEIEYKVQYAYEGFLFGDKVTTIKNESKVHSFLEASKYLLKLHKRPDATYTVYDRVRLSLPSTKSVE